MSARKAYISRFPSTTDSGTTGFRGGGGALTSRDRSLQFVEAGSVRHPGRGELQRPRLGRTSAEPVTTRHLRSRHGPRVGHAGSRCEGLGAPPRPSPPRSVPPRCRRTGRRRTRAGPGRSRRPHGRGRLLGGRAGPRLRLEILSRRSASAGRFMETRSRSGRRGRGVSGLEPDVVGEEARSPRVPPLARPRRPVERRAAVGHRSEQRGGRTAGTRTPPDLSSTGAEAIWSPRSRPLDHSLRCGPIPRTRASVDSGARDPPAPGSRPTQRLRRRG
jgi:hypothetical protein